MPHVPEQRNEKYLNGYLTLTLTLYNVCVLKHYIVSHKYIECLCVHFKFQFLRVKEMTQRGLVSKHE